MKIRETIFLLLVLVLFYGVAAVEWSEKFKVEESEKGKENNKERMFVIQKIKRVVKTEAGEIRLAMTPSWSLLDRPIHVGFLTMDPNSLFLPHYADCNMVIFVHKGEGKVGSIYKGKFVEKELKSGDLYGIPAGSSWYLLNHNQKQKLQTISSIDPIENIGLGTFKSFYVGGGTYPVSILAGFDHETLATAFNVSNSSLKKFLTSQHHGSFVHLHNSHSQAKWKNFLQNKQERSKHLRKLIPYQENYSQKEEVTWPWRKVLNNFFGEETEIENNESGTSYSHNALNVYEQNPDFKNNYGWSISLDKSKFSPLKHSGLGVYLFNLSAGSMMAPHVNPIATEYGVVLKGSGRIQIVSPNGGSAMDAKVKEGDVFWVPRYFPFCQIASESNSLEIFGFTTSAQENHPEFLVGHNSILNAMESPELAAAYGISEKSLKHVLNAQKQSVILPSRSESQSSQHTRNQGNEAKKDFHHY